MSESEGSLLTPTQREFLRDETDITWDDPRGRTLRTRMRSRIHTGIRDFEYLSDPARFDTRDLELVRDALDDEQELVPSLAELVAFVYRLAPERFESVVETGTRRGVGRCTPEFDVEDVNISIRKRGRILKQAREKIDQNEPLRDSEIRVLLCRGDISPEELRDYVQQQEVPQADTHRYRFR